MSDTPRTDQKHEVICESWSSSVSSFPEMTEFARQLERELTAVTEQRDGLRSGIDYASDQLSKVTKQRDRLAEALRSIKNELGIPQPEYPTPVANAVKIADEAIQSLTQNAEL